MARLVFSVLALLFLSAHTPAASLSGRLTTSFYTWKAQEVDGTSSTHLRFYQAAIVNFQRVGGRPLSFHTYAQVSGDAAEGAAGRSDYRVTNATLQWRPRGGALDLSAGRQRVYGGVGFGTIDGLNLEAKPHEALRLKAFAGVLVPIVPDDGLGTWDEGHLWGGQALFDWRTTTLGASFAERAREPLPYAAPGRYSGVLPAAADGRQFRRVGLDARSEHARLHLYGRLDLDLGRVEGGLKARDLQAVATVDATDRIQVTGEFNRREPTIYLNSVLSVFEVSSNQEAAGRIAYRMSDLVRLSSDAAFVDYDGDTSWRIGVGMLVGNGSFSYSRRLGYGGENDAFSASFLHPLTPALTLKADGSVSGYKLYEGQPTRDQALAGSLGMRYRARRDLWVDVEGQAIRNKYYADDYRLFVRGSWWFFKRGKP